MKLVIDIHEGDYRYIKQLQSITMARGTCKTIQRDVINAIKKGTPYEERTKGKWIESQEEFEDAFIIFKHECSNCKEITFGGGNFCPNCGADMRGNV